MSVMSDDRQLSRYEAAGSPTKCFLPLCRKPFEGTCFHGRDGRYYCSKECAEKAYQIDLTRVEELRPSRNPTTIPINGKRTASGQ
jgi:hypothetical protein